MRTTVRVDDELLEQLKAQARREKVSMTRLLNRALKAGLQAGGGRRRAQRAYRERVHAMGVPRHALDNLNNLNNLNKALALAATLEDEEIVRKLALRK